VTEQGVTRVLHIVGKMDRGGVESWLVQLLRHVDRSRVRMDVLVHSASPGALDGEARELGAEIINCPDPSRPVTYARNFLDVLRRGPGYDVVHSHVHHFSAFPLELARRAGVPVRVAHSHSDMSAVHRSAGPARQAYLGTARRLLRSVPTDRLAASTAAGRALFGPSWTRNRRDRVVHYGIDVQRFHAALDSDALRRELGLPAGSLVVGHVGRFEREKNHAFLVDVMTDLSRRDENVVLLLVGTGSLHREIEELVAARGLGRRVLFAGPRSDVPDLMRGAMDAFLLPSFYEGLPIVGIEAQEAGLPCVFSDAVTRETSIVPGLTRYLPLGDPELWATAVLALRGRAGSSRSGGTCLEGSSFDVRTCVDTLAGIYTGAPVTAGRRGASTDGADERAEDRGEVST
jgi:glycosyltransferase involved in cell wall biosynthesis